MFCTKCGQANQDGAKFCTGCGATFNAATPASDDVAKAKAETPPAVEKTIEKPVVAAVTPKKMTPKEAPPKAVAPEKIVTEEAISTEPASPSKEKSGSNKNVFLMIGVAIIIALIAGAVWLYPRHQTTNKSADKTTQSAVNTTAPSITSEQPATVSPEPTTTSTPIAPTKPATANHQTVTLSNSEIKNLVARLQKETPPANCRAGEAKVRKEGNVSGKHAKEIAKRAYPDLCGTTSAKTTPVPPPPATSTAPKSASKTINQVYEERSKAECDSGIVGFVCREALKLKICDGKWSSSPPSGQSICFVQDN